MRLLICYFATRLTNLRCVKFFQLGIVTEKKHPTFRHSLLNFDHINILDDEESKVRINKVPFYHHIVCTLYSLLPINQCNL